MWQYTGKQRPKFAVEPLAGQESVWDYPRPPICVEDDREVLIRYGDVELARSNRVIRVLETASPPTIYIPHADVNLNLFRRSPHRSYCEWKGMATYWTLKLDADSVDNCAWSYVLPNPQFERIKGHFAFYPNTVSCWLGQERVHPQAGGFYGGWVTSDITGPWKGDSGTAGW